MEARIINSIRTYKIYLYTYERFQKDLSTNSCSIIIHAYDIMKYLSKHFSQIFHKIFSNKIQILLTLANIYQGFAKYFIQIFNN